MTKYIKLINRSVIHIHGKDRKNFLQNLITNDINKSNQTNAIYSALLTPQGRFLYDFFIIENEDKLLLDCNKEKSDQLIKKLSLYKLNSEIEIEKTSLSVFSIFEKGEEIPPNFIIFKDPRNDNMGFRIIAKDKDFQQNPFQEESFSFYNNHRMNLKIADDNDLSYDKSLILEYGFENLNAVDYQKGCYIGQEVTARTHYKGVIRKSIYLVELSDNKIQKGDEITCDDKKLGIILSPNFYQDRLSALALIKNTTNLDKLELKANNQKITLIK